MTDDPANEDFEYMAHRRGDTQKDMFYIGAYLGYVADNKLRSLSGKTPTKSNNFSDWLNKAHANGTPDGNGGSGYDLFAWYQLIFIQCMYVLKYKNLNSQQALGGGNVSGSAKQTGGTNTVGMDYGNPTNYTTQLKLFGIEEFYGSYRRLIDGVWCGDSMNLYTATDNFDASRTSYVNRGSIGTSSSQGLGWVKKTSGTTHGGFCATSMGASETTYYCDHPRMNENAMLWYGGNVSYGRNAEAGVFYLNFEHTWDHGDTTTCGALMYL